MRRGERGDAESCGERDDPPDGGAGDRAAADGPEVDLIAGEEEEHRQPEVGEEGDERVGHDPAEHRRTEKQTECDLEHHEWDRHPACESADEEGCRDGDRRNEHQGAYRIVHIAPRIRRRTHVVLSRC